MSRTMLKVRAEGDIIKVSTYNREIGRKGYFCFLRHDFDGLQLNVPYICEDLGCFAKLTKAMGWSGEELTMRFVWLDDHGNSEYSGIGETICLNYAELKKAIQESNDSGKEVTLLDLVMKFPKIEFQADRNLQTVVSDESIRKKLFSFLNRNFQWPTAKKIRILNDFEPYSFYFEEELYDDSLKGLCGGIVYHANGERPHEGRYAIHT